MPMYARGTIAKGLCQRCGFDVGYANLMFDGYYPNLRVCSDCYDPPQPQEKLAIVSDPTGLWKPSPDATYIAPPVLGFTVSGANNVLSWGGFNADSAGRPSGGPNITAGYYVYRAPVDDMGNVSTEWTQIASLPNSADEFGAYIVETTTYTDTPGAGVWAYKVLGYDVLFNAEYGA